MQNHKKTLRIPKDPRSDNKIFISELPLDLINIIDQREWEDCIAKINKVFEDLEKPSKWNLLKLFLVIPSFLKIKTYEKELSKAISEINSQISSKGLRIEDPQSNGYIELVVIYLKPNKN